MNRRYVSLLAVLCGAGLLVVANSSAVLAADAPKDRPSLSEESQPETNGEQPSGPRTLTQEQEKQLEQARLLSSEADRLRKAGQYAKAIPPAQESLRIRREILGLNHADTATSLNDLAGLYHKTGAYEKAKPLHIQARDIRKKVLGDEHPDYATSMNDLAGNYLAMGEYTKAEPLFIQVLDIRKKVLGEERPDYVTSLNGLAELYYVLDEDAKAELLFIQARNIRKKVRGEKHPDNAVSSQVPPGTFTREQQLEKARTLNAQVYRLWKGREYAKAIPLAQEALRIRKEVLGLNHADTAMSLFNLAAQYRAIGEYAKAKPLQLQAHEIWKESLGEEHPQFVISLDNLAGLYKAMGEHAKAEPFYARAREIQKKVLGEEHPNNAVSRQSRTLTEEQEKQLEHARMLNSQVYELWKAGEYAKAVPLAQETLRITKDIRGLNHADTAMSLLNLAAQYEGLGEYAKAEPLCIQARDIWKKTLGEEHPQYAIGLNSLAVLYKAMGEHAKAEPLLIQTLDIRKKVLGKEHPDYAKCLSDLGLLYSDMGEYKKAEPLLVQARDTTKKVLGEEHADYASRLHTLATLYYEIGQFAKAEPLLVQTRDIRKKILGERHPDYARCLGDLAKLYLDRGEYAKAAPLVDQNREIFEKTLGKEHPDYAACLGNLAVLYANMGEYAKAEPLCVQALVITKKVLGEEHQNYATGLSNLAALYKDMGEYRKAVALYAQARGIRKSALGVEHPWYAMSLSNLGLLYLEMGECAKAEPLFVQALDIRKKVLGKEHPDYTSSLNNLGLLYIYMGDYAKAEPLFVQALNITKNVLGKEHLDYARYLNNLAGFYMDVGEYAKAEPLYVQALNITKNVLGEEHLDYARYLNSLATFYMDVGEYAKAEPMLVQARDIVKRTLGEEHPRYATGLNQLAVLYKDIGDYAKAEPLFFRAHEIWKTTLGEEHPSCALGLNNLAVLYWNKGDYTKAEPLARASMDIMSTFTNREIGFLPEAQSVALSARHTGPNLLLSILREVPQQNDLAAFTTVWRTRGLASRSLAARRQGRGQSPEAKMLWEQLQTKSQRLAQLTLAVPRPDQRKARQRRLAELNDEKERLETELARASAEFRRSQHVAAAMPQDLARLLREDEAIVELLAVTVWSPPPSGRGKGISERHYDAFVLRRGDVPHGMNINWVQLGAADLIDAAVFRWRRAITDKRVTASEAREAAEDLRQRVWDKIEPHLAGCDRVTIAPDGQLCFLPWAALPGRKAGMCLLEDYAIATAPCARRLYDILTNTQNDQGKPLLVGGVAYDTEPSAHAGEGMLLAGNPGPSARTRSPAMKKELHWDPLPQTEMEIDAIAKGWSGNPEPVVLRGARASEQAAREQLPGSRYIHLATHGFFADPHFRSMFGHDVQGEQLFGDVEMLTARRGRVTARNPLILSGLVFAGANLPPKTDELGLPTGEDGILTAEEIVGLDLRGTELAVLSACDTGLGDVAGGEGVMGLTRAFHLAGTRNVIASLWKVDDNATAALMKLFYHKLWEENKPPIEALREAQLFVYRNPDLIDKVATTRGFDLANPSRLPDGGRAKPGAKTTETRRWAAFLLSGPGR